MENPPSSAQQALCPAVITDSEEEYFSCESDHGEHSSSENEGIKRETRLILPAPQSPKEVTVSSRGSESNHPQPDWRTIETDPWNSSTVSFPPYPPQRSNTNVAVHEGVGDDRSPRPPSKSYGPATSNLRSNYARGSRVPPPSREQRWWDVYNADPNISGQRWGELARPNFSHQTNRSSTSRQEELRSHDHRHHVPPYNEQFHDPSANPNPPPVYGRSSFPNTYNYPDAPSNCKYPPDWVPNHPSALGANTYTPNIPPGDSPGLPIHPPARPIYPPSVPFYPQFPPRDSCFPSTGPNTQQSYPPHANSFPDFSQSIRRRNSFSDEASCPSSSDEEEEWPKTPDQLSTGEAESDQLLSHQHVPQCALLSPNVGVDEDLLNPSAWERKVSAIEAIIMQSHLNRKSWPIAWRYSDSKTCPNAMKEVWADVCEVDTSITKLGLDAVTLSTIGSTYDLKQKGTLGKLLYAFKSQPSPAAVTDLPEATASLPQPSALPALPSEPEALDDTLHEVLRLLKARDYLIMVCRDAEYLNELHPSMDAITWFQLLPHTLSSPNEASRPMTIELRSISLSQLARIISCLNLILQAILWGWGDQSSIRFDSHEEKNRLYLEGLLGFQAFLTLLHSMTGDPIKSAELVVSYFETMGLGLSALNEDFEKLSAILAQALTLQCDVHIALHNAPENIYSFYGIKAIPDLIWVPQNLDCMAAFIHDRRVWVLKQNNSSSISSTDYTSMNRAQIRTTIRDLTKIWGPIWKVLEIEDKSHWVWYRLAEGYLGQPPGQQPLSEADESPCHFSTDVQSFGECPSTHFDIPDKPYLLIGHGLPAGLVHRKSCQIGFERGLQGFTLQTLGTLAPFRYRDCTTLQFGVNQFGISANWSTQFKINPGILAKDNYLQRWKREPGRRDPRLLQLWYGVEISLCTRNARRCRIVDLLRSHVIVQYLRSVYSPPSGSDSHLPAMFAALESSESCSFANLYKDHPEWRVELGMVVAHCLELLKGTGVNRNGDLAAFAFMKRFDDVQQVAVLPKKTYTWTGLLKDSYDMATFAIVSTRCLEYRGAPGQMCRRKARTRASKSILETSYMPAKRLDVRRLLQNMRANDRLKMKSSGKFKIKERSTSGILLGTWDPSRFMFLPSLSREQFQERRQEMEQAIKVFVVSKRKQVLPKLKRRPKLALDLGITGSKPSPTALSNQEGSLDHEQIPLEVSSGPLLLPPDTPAATRSSQAKFAMPPPFGKASIGIVHQGSQSCFPRAPNHAMSLADEDLPLRPEQPVLLEFIDKGVQTDLNPELPILHQDSNSENQAPEHQVPEDPACERHQAPENSETIIASSHTQQYHRQADYNSNEPTDELPQQCNNADLPTPEVDGVRHPRKQGRRRRKDSTSYPRQKSDGGSLFRSSDGRSTTAASSEASRPKGRRSRTGLDDLGPLMMAFVTTSLVFPLCT